MSPSYGIQGQLLEINVVGCRNLRDTEWFTKQDPYVVIEYASTRLRTKTDTDGGRNPSFDEKFMIPLIECLREFNVHVWNSNTLSQDDYIGTGRVQIENALSSGYDDNSWHLTNRHGKYAGELRLIMHFTKKEDTHCPLAAPPVPQAPAYPYAPAYGAYSTYAAAPPPPPPPPPPVLTGYPPYGNPYPTYAAYVPPQPAYVPPPAAYPPQGYPPCSCSGYPPYQTWH